MQEGRDISHALPQENCSCLQQRGHYDSSFLNPHHSFVWWYIPRHDLSTLMMSQHPEQRQGSCWSGAVQLLEVDVPEQIKQWWYFLKLYPCIIWETILIYGTERRFSQLYWKDFVFLLPVPTGWDEHLRKYWMKASFSKHCSPVLHWKCPTGKKMYQTC